ncbi:MAG: gephyrin-like molybdotransferase Glp [Sedimentisphaerales bacterium]
MLLFDKALRIVLKSARFTGTERVDIAHAVNRILAEDVKSDIDMPPFNKAAMDGYACRREDLAKELTVIETIPAGVSPKRTIGANQCAKIMTGSVVPVGANCVIMKEYAETRTKNTVSFVGEKTADNICPKGEDIKAGDVVLHKGTLLRPQHIAVLACVGSARPMVAKRPKVGIFATGNELIEPASQPGPSQIRNSNSFQLAAQVESIGAVVRNYGIAKDTHQAIDNMFKKVAEENHVVIVSGGVSVGEFDILPTILRQNNVELLFENIALKPGKPTVFGISEKAYCFGLPGNPVASFVLFELMVKPFLYKLMGHDYAPPDIQMPLGESIKLKKVKRQSWVPVAITGVGTLKPVEYHGSAHIGALCKADGLVSVDVGVAEIAAPTVVRVRLI